MNKTYLNDTNYVTLVGKPTDNISEEFTTPDGKKFITAQFICTRMSGIDDYIMLTMPAKDKGLLRFSRLFVKGRYRTYNIDGHLVQRVFVDEMGPILFEDNDVNQFIFTGTIVNIKPLRESPQGKVILDIVVAINTGKKTAYVPCVVWGNSARYLSDSPVGTRISCTARLQSRVYEKIIDDVKNTRMAYEVSVLDLEVIDNE